MTRIALVLVLGSLATTAVAEPSRGKAGRRRALGATAQRHLDAGLDAYKRDDYASASREFELAYRIDPDPSLLYASAQARRLDKDCEAAVRLYRLYLDAELTRSQRAAGIAGIKACADATPSEREATAREPEPSPEPEPPKKRRRVAKVTRPVDDPGDAPEEREDRPARRTFLVHQAWYSDPVGGVLLGTGVAATGGGIAFLVASNRSARRAVAALDRDAFGAALDESRRRRWIGMGLSAAGGALVIGGIVRYALFEPVDRRITAQLVPARDGASVFVAGVF